jgi:hypothetical protein
VQRCEQARYLAALGESEHDGSIHVRSVHNDTEVFGEDLGRREVIGRQAVRESDPASIDHHHTPKVEQRTKPPGELRLFPLKFEMRDLTGDEQDVMATDTDRLVGDVHTVGRPRITGFACGHGAS